MPSKETITITVTQHPSEASLPPEYQELVRKAAEAARRAYAPYSHFHVGAALLLHDGRVVTGNNQENASYPAGTCAERTALHAAMSETPDAVVQAIAIAVPDAHGERPVPPCGICRQALVEQEQRQGVPMRLLLAATGGIVQELMSAHDLLPLSFNARFLQP